MKKLLAIYLALALGGCASTQMQKVAHRPASHVVPQTAPMPSPTPVVVTPPASPVTVTKLGKPRWYDETKKAGHWVAGHVPHFHHKAAVPADVQKGN